MEREYVQGERVCTGGREFESETRGSQTRGSRCINKFPQTRGSRPAFKSGHEENADANVGSASR